MLRRIQCRVTNQVLQKVTFRTAWWLIDTCIWSTNYETSINSILNIEAIYIPLKKDEINLLVDRQWLQAWPLPPCSLSSLSRSSSLAELSSTTDRQKMQRLLTVLLVEIITVSNLLSCLDSLQKMNIWRIVLHLLEEVRDVALAAAVALRVFTLRDTGCLLCCRWGRDATASGVFFQ